MSGCWFAKGQLMRILCILMLLGSTLCRPGFAATSVGGRSHVASFKTIHAVEGEPLTLDLATFSQKNKNLTFEVQELPSGADFDQQQGIVEWTPGFHQAGTFVVTFTGTGDTPTDGPQQVKQTVLIQVQNTNRPPQISGDPEGVATAEQIYYFAPATVDPDGGNLRFAARGIPSWASFDPQNGAVSGIPDQSDIGSEAEILITVTDGIKTAALPEFVVRVVAPASVVEMDLRPADQDTDGDQVADVRDGFPFDPTRADWVIRTATGEGGEIYPAGEVSVLFGGSRDFRVVPRAGYYLDDLLVNGQSVGLLDSYEFVNVKDHHRIEARFSQIPYGLSRNPIDQGLSGVRRVDGGDSSHNRVDDKAHPGLAYQFHIIFRSEGLADNYRVFVVLNGCRYPMTLEQGVLASGARFGLTTRLGPASHRFHFVVEDLKGQSKWRFPVTGELPGPIVELLSGRNLVGIAAHVNPYGLTAGEVVGGNALYRWLPYVIDGRADDSGNEKRGSFAAMDNFIPVAAGEGYLLRNRPETTWGDFGRYGEIPFDEYEFDVAPGWNLIANPYGCNVPLSRVQVRVGEAESLLWSEAAARQQVADGLFSYRGDDWGGDYLFAAADGTNSAVLIPWVGYWVYIKKTGMESGERVSLIIPKNGYHDD